MELHKAIKEIVGLKGLSIINDTQIINFLLDYQAFKEKPATKLILRDIINSGYAEEILSLNSQDASWILTFMKFKRDFIESCGYKEELVDYVFEAIVYGIGFRPISDEPNIDETINVDDFFEIEESETSFQIKAEANNSEQKVNPNDIFTIALTFFNEGKYSQAKSFIEKSISLYHNSNIPSIQLKLKGDINMKMAFFTEAIKDYNNCFAAKAREERCAIDKLRESLKKHEIKGFENSLYCYYLCLYSIGKISKVLWHKLVKEEAMYGLDDAIMYCVQNGINPMEDHFDIYFTDKSQLRIGDYLYEDGTFSHELSTSKKIIAKVLIAETSDFEQKQGWTHGYLIAARADGRPCDSKMYMWCSENKDLLFPHAHYTINDINHFKELKVIESEHYIKIDDYLKFPAFAAVKNYQVKIPIASTSHWFLPSIHWFQRYSYYLTRFGYNFIHSYGRYWTASQADSSNAVYVEYTSSSSKRGYFIWDHYGIASKNEVISILPVAAF